MKLVPAQIKTEERLQLISENYESAIREGYRCLRVAQEIILYEELLEYETKLNEFYPKIPALGIWTNRGGALKQLSEMQKD